MTASKAAPALSASGPGHGRYNFVARQPIFTADEKVFGYELLFRDGVEDYFRAQDPDAASRKALDTSLQIGIADPLRRTPRLRQLHPRNPDQGLHHSSAFSSHRRRSPRIRSSRRPGQGRPASASSRPDTRSRSPTLPPTIPASRSPTSPTSSRSISAPPPRNSRRLVKRYGPWRCRMLAEKVETREEFLAAKTVGFVYFQGYFFRKPGTDAGPRGPRQPPQLRAHAPAVSRPELDVARTRTPHQAGSFASAIACCAISIPPPSASAVKSTPSAMP